MNTRAELRATLLWVWVPGLLLVGLSLLVSLTTEVTMRELFQDGNTVTGAPFYVGLMSTLGVTLWAAAAAICLFVGAAIGRIPGPMRRLLLVSGLFTAVLMADDAFLIHDAILPQLAGITGDLYGIGYVVAMACYLYFLRRTLARTNYQLLTAALVLFAVSAAVDVASSRLADSVPSTLIVLVEDGSKLLGIGTWLAYFVSVSGSAVAQAVGSPAQGQ